MAAMLLLALCLGCGGPHDSSVSGTVYLDGELLRMGNVTFYPSAGGAAVYSQIAEDGTYELQTGSEAGLKPGEYKVTVIATDNPPPQPGQTPAIGPRITPEKYSRLKQTDLVFTVSPGANQIDLRLNSD
jgi:hypothetical protein